MELFGLRECEWWELTESRYWTGHACRADCVWSGAVHFHFSFVVVGRAQGPGIVCLLAVVVDKLSPNRVFLSGDRGDIGALCRSPQLCLSNNFPPASSASPDRSLCTDTLSSWNTSLVVWSVVWTSGSAHTQTHIVQLVPPPTHTQTHIVQLTPPPTQTHIVQLTPPSHTHTDTHCATHPPSHTHTQTHIVQLTPPPTHTHRHTLYNSPPPHRHTLYNSPPLPHTHRHTLYNSAPPPTHTQTHIVQLTPPSHTHTQTDRHMHVAIVPESQTSIFTIACKLPLFTSRLSYTCSVVPNMYTACPTVAVCF